MKLLQVALLTLVPSLAIADRDDGDATVYNDANAKVSHDCAKSPRIVINGSGGTYAFKGTCTKLAVNGSNLVLTVESIEHFAINGSSNTADVVAADKIAITGSKNTVAYKKGITKAKPKTVSLGSENKFTQK